MQLFIEEYTTVFHLNISQQIFWYSPFKPSYLLRPINEEYFYWVFVQLEIMRNYVTFHLVFETVYYM